MSKKPTPATKPASTKKATTPAAPASKSTGKPASKPASKLPTNAVKARVIEVLKSEGVIAEPVFVKPAIRSQMKEKAQKHPQTSGKTPPKTKGSAEEISKKATDLGQKASKTPVKAAIESAKPSTDKTNLTSVTKALDRAVKALAKPSATVKTIQTESSKVGTAIANALTNTEKSTKQLPLKVAAIRDTAVKKPATKAEVNQAMHEQTAAGHSLKVSTAVKIKPPVGGLGKNAANDFAKTAPSTLQGFTNDATVKNVASTTSVAASVTYTFDEIERNIQSLETGIAAARGRVGISEGLSVLHGWRNRGAVRFNGLYTDVFKFAIDGSAPDAIRTFIDRINEFVRMKAV